MDRRIIFILVSIITLTLLVILRRRQNRETYAPGVGVGVDNKLLIEKYIKDNGKVLSEKPYLIYGLFKQITGDDKILNNVVTLAKKNDVTKLLEILGAI